MGLVRLALRRLFAQRSLAAAMIVTFGFTGGVLVAAPIYAVGAEQAIVYGSVERAPALSRDLIATFTMPPGLDIGVADATVRRLLAPMAIRSLAFQERSDTFTVTSSDGAGRTSVVYRDGLLQNLGLTDGGFPTGPDEVLLPQATASILSVVPGDEIRLAYSGESTARVAGIYASIPAAAPLIVSGTSASTKGSVPPIIATSEGFSRIVGEAGQTSGLRVAWEAEPDVRGSSVDGLVGIAARERTVAGSISVELGASVSSNLGTLVPEVRRAVTESRAPIYLVVLQVAMVGLGVSIGLGSLKLRRQAFELSILKTRGAPNGFLVSLQAIELIVTAVLGWGLALATGFVLAILARAAHGPGAPGAPFGLKIGAAAAQIGLAGIGGAAVILLLLSLPHLRRSVLAERREISRERRPAWLRFPSEVLPLAMGAAALVELHRRGIQATEDHLDALVLLAPTLLLLGGSLVAVRAFFWLIGRIERAADRSGSPSVFLGLHRLSRSSANMSLMLLLVLSTGLFAFSSSLRTTVLDHNTIAARGQVGADVQYLVPLPGGDLQAAAKLPVGTTLVFKGPVITAGDPRLAYATVVGLDPHSYLDGGWLPSQTAAQPLPDLLGHLLARPIGSPLHPGTTAIQIEVSAASPAPAGVRLVAPCSYPDGTVRDLDLGALQGGTQTYETQTDGAVRLLSLMLTAPSLAPPEVVRAGSFSVTFDRLSLSGGAGDQSVPIDGWRGLRATRLVVRTAVTSTGGLDARFQVAGGGPIGGIAPVDPPLPALLPAGASLGGPIEVELGFAGFSVRSVGTLRTFPTVSSASAPIVVPIGPLVDRFHQILQPPNGGIFEVLGMGTGDPTAGIRRAGFAVGPVQRAADIEAALATSPQNLALGMEFAAGVAGATLAVMALGVALFFGARRRRYELSSLRALGGRRSHAVVALALEYGSVLVPAALTGALGGIALLRLVLTAVAPPASGAGPVLLAIDARGVAVATAAALLTLGLGLLSTGRQIGATDSISELRGEPE